MLTSNNGIVFGAAYTDVHLRLPLLIALAAVALIAAVGCVYNIWLAGIRLPIAAAVLVFAVSIVQTIVPGLFQSYWVKPDELKLESRYIASNIEFTRYGFGLDHITSAPFPAKGKLTPEVVAANQATIQNIRWWDPRPLLDTYRQLQEIRLYYDFHDIDVDRYVIEGSYRQVLLSARELNQSKLPADAQTWINQRFKFTHGNGIAMNPVNRFDNEGLPVFYVKDIPPVGPPELQDRPPGDLFRRGDQKLCGGRRRHQRIRLRARVRKMSTTFTKAATACPWAVCGGARCLPGRLAISNCLSATTSPRRARFSFGA